MKTAITINPHGDELLTSSKPFDIPKRLVWDAWQQIRRNGGAAGVDEISLEQFERNLEKNLYRIWNRLSSGSYFPPPVKEIMIPKKEWWSASTRYSHYRRPNCSGSH